MLKYTSLVLAAAACACFVNGLRPIDPAVTHAVPTCHRGVIRLCHAALNVGDTSNANFPTVRAQIATTQDHPEYRAALRGLSIAELTEAFRLANVHQSAVDDISNANLPTVHAQIATAKDHAAYRAALDDLSRAELTEAFRLANVQPSPVGRISNENLPTVHAQIATAKIIVGLMAFDENVLAEAFARANVQQEADIHRIDFQDLVAVWWAAEEHAREPARLRRRQQFLQEAEAAEQQYNNNST
jgi:hypothetical protein